ncbi:MAG: GCN5-related N-acetyltransferase [Myxococcaceae bacterium]|nr:GCN5-related N-acetyltransferase [Myxococcaceae bacterium]
MRSDRDEPAAGRDRVISIVRATVADAPLLSGLAARTFVESHGHSAPAADVEAYVAAKYAVSVLRSELADPTSIYHLACVDGAAAGFSKVTLHTSHEHGDAAEVGRLDRLYVLAEHYGSGAGPALMDHLLGLMKREQQAGVWLYVWKGNPRAVRFYQKRGFAITGSHDFALSPTHSNPNHRMFLAL